MPSPDGDDSEAFHASVTDDETGQVFSIGPDADGIMIVTERMQADYPPEIDPEEDDDDERALLEEQLSSTSVGIRGTLSSSEGRALDTSYSYIGILVLWTSNAECRAAGRSRGCSRSSLTKAAIRGLIDLAIAETNVAYVQSGVNAELLLVHAAHTNYNDSGDFADALYRLRDSNDGYMDEAHSLRSQYGAGKSNYALPSLLYIPLLNSLLLYPISNSQPPTIDAVALIIDNSQYCGIAYLGPSKDRMFSVTQYSCATGYYSFGHEVGQ